MMLKRARATIASVTAAAMLAGTSLVAVPAAQAASAGYYNGAPVVLAGHRDDRRWKKRQRSHRHYRHRRNNDFPALFFGLAAGALLGSALSQPQYHGSSRDAYCASKYKTYKPWTGTYRGYDGREHYCR